MGKERESSWGVRGRVSWLLPRDPVAQFLAWGAAQAVGGRAGVEGEGPLAASLCTCWSCSDPPRARPAIKRKDIVHYVQEDEGAPPLWRLSGGRGHNLYGREKQLQGLSSPFCSH